MKKNFTTKKISGLDLLAIVIFFLFSYFFATVVFGNSQNENQTKPNFNPNSLLKKASAISEKNNDWVPGRIYISDETKNKKGKIVNHAKTSIKSTINQNQQIKWTLISATENGKDKTKKLKKDFNQNDNNFFPEEDKFDPFLLKFKDKITFQARQGREKIRDKTCVVFRFISKSPTEKWEGLAYIEETTGYPLLLRVIEPESIQDDDCTISNRNTTIQYVYGPDGRWFADKVTMTMDLKVKSLLFFKSNLSHSSVIRMEEYWKASEIVQ